MEMVTGLIELASHEIAQGAETEAGSIKAFLTRSTNVTLVGTEPNEAILTIAFSGIGALSFHLSAEQIATLSTQLTQLAPRSHEAAVH